MSSQLPFPGLEPGRSWGLRAILARFFGSAVANAAGYAIGGAVQPALEPLTRDIANQTWALHRVAPLAAGTAAEAVARGYMEPDAGDDEAAHAGQSGRNFGALVQLAYQTPPTETLLALRRRERITDADVTRGLTQLGVRPEWRAHVAALRYVVPSVTELIQMAVREVFDPGQRAALDLDAEFPAAFGERAEATGISPQHARDSWAAHWQLPSYEQLARMLFRGELTSATFSAALKALDYAPTWRGKLETIARPIPPLQDMIRFAVRDVYSPDTVNRFGLGDEFPSVFAQQAALHGMEAPYPQQYWAAHWRLPSALQGYRMLWRGEITAADLDGLLKALDYPPFWRPKLAAIARIVPGRIDLKRMLRHEILTAAQVEAGYQRLGYSAEDAERMTRIAVAELADAETGQPWAQRARGRLYTVAHNEYLAASIDAATARAMLGRLGAAAGEQSTVIALWDAERTINRLELTPAQIKKAWKSDQYDEATALAELRERGMSDADAQTFLRS